MMRSTAVVASTMLVCGPALALERVLVNGVAIQSFRNTSESVLAVGDNLVRRVETHTRMDIKSIHEGDGRTYVLVSIGGGLGRLCPTLWLAIEMTEAKPRVSKDFGTCSDALDVSVSDGALRVVMDEPDGRSRSTYSFKDGRLTERKVAISMTQGPDRAPGGNLAAFVAGKHPSEVIKLKTVADALKRILPPDVFEEVRKRALTGPGVAFQTDSRFAIGHSCIKHNCGGNTAFMVFDHAGAAWAAVETEGVKKFYGEPPSEVRAVMK